MGLGRFDIGRTVVVEERWHGLLWSAVPHRVVNSSGGELVSWVTDGAVSTRASTRGMPGTESLTRDERKLLGLRSRRARVVESREAPHKLFFHRRDRWSRVNLGWSPETGEFLGWYVNFEYPPRSAAAGVCSMDLVIDIWVDPDRTWQWKDRADFAAVLAEGLLPAEVGDRIEKEAELVLAELDAGMGPFQQSWAEFAPDPTWQLPVLPEPYAWSGDEWVLPPGPRLG